MIKNNKKYGFSLPEALITLIIVGVLAAITVPTLLSKVSKLVYKHKMSVFNQKFSQGIDLLSINSGIGPYYKSSYEFVKALSNHMKLMSTCDENNLDDCIPYSHILVDNNTYNSVYLTQIKDGKNFGSTDKNYSDVAAFTTADGVPMILS